MHRFHAPVDPECPEVKEYTETLLNDPLTHAMHAPVDEILEHWENNHRSTCKHCQEYGTANMEVQ